jgi:hypothetical protein
MNVIWTNPWKSEDNIDIIADMPDGNTIHIGGFEKSIERCIPSKAMFEELIESAKIKVERVFLADIGKASNIIVTTWFLHQDSSGKSERFEVRYYSKQRNIMVINSDMTVIYANLMDLRIRVPHYREVWAQADIEYGTEPSPRAGGCKRAL